MGLRIGWYSNSPTAPTGYGNQTKQVARRLRDAGHDVHVITNYGQTSGQGILDWEGIKVWPQGATQYSLDTVDASIAAIEPDFVVTLFDVWPFGTSNFRQTPAVHWTPVDHDPLPPAVFQWITSNGEGMRPIISMSEFGRDVLAQKGIPSAYIPHTVEDVYQPRDGKAQRAQMSVPEDAFLIGIVAANLGVSPPRKMWVENLQAAAEMMRRHDDVYLYLHTDLDRPGGLNISYWATMVGIDPNRVRIVDTLAYRVGSTTEEQMSYLYSAMDVLQLCSGGEGFGIPVIEAMRSGTPAIVTDFSAQPELVGDTGWKVGYQLLADLPQGSWLAKPNVDDIVLALEQAYAERGSEAATARSEAARARAIERYDADTVFAKKWVPLIAEMQVGINKAKAARAGLIVPESGLVTPAGKPINTAIRPKGQKRRSNKGRK